MEKILTILVGAWVVIERFAAWSSQNPEAAAFLTAVGATAVNYIVKLTPWRGDDSLVDIVVKTIGKAKERARAIRGR